MRTLKSGSASRTGGWVNVLIGLGVAILALAVLAIASPIALLAYKRHRIHSYCASIHVGEPVAAVAQRGDAEGFMVFGGVEPLAPDAPVSAVAGADAGINAASAQDVSQASTSPGQAASSSTPDANGVRVRIPPSAQDAQPPDPDSSDLMVSTNFMLAHLICNVQARDGKVVGTSENELW